MKKLFFFCSFLLFPFFLQASVILKAPDSFVNGESYIFEYEAVGSSVDFPKIKQIDGFTVEDLGSSRSLQIINGNYDEKILKRFRIVPNKSFTIPPFVFKIDGKEIKSEEKKVSERKIQKTKSDYFDLTITPSKKQLYVGESLIVKLTFKYKRGLQITNLGFEPPHFENFWYKKIDNSNKRYEENGYNVQELDFLLFPQKSGVLQIKPLRVDVQMVDTNSSSNFTFFSSAPKLEKVYSNNLSFNVKALPSDVTLIGDFVLNASIDKDEINLGESINYRLEITGFGNFDDIEDFKLDIPNTTIYDNKAEVETNFKDNKYEGKYSKVFSIVPNTSLEIPPFELKFFNKEENKVKVLKSKSFKIKVNGEKQKEVVLQKPIEKEEKVLMEKEFPLVEKIKYFLFGALSVLLIFCLYIYVKLQKSKKKIKETSLSKLIKSSKDKLDLMKILIPYLKRDNELDNLIFECEKSNLEFKVLKKKILEKITQLNL